MRRARATRNVGPVRLDPLDEFPRALDGYPSADSLLGTLAARVAAEPFNAVATAIFALAVLHTFVAPRFAARAHALHERHRGRPSVAAELLHFLGEIEVVFGLWAIVLFAALALNQGWSSARHYFNDTVVYTEALFVVVIMALAATRPVMQLAERALRWVARLGGGRPAAWWLAILVLGPLLGSFITEPAAMTISALLLARPFYELEPSPRLRYATLGLLFVNVSIGGTLTHFAAPPVLMVARPWGWDTGFLLTHFGGRAVIAILASTGLYYLVFRSEFAELARRAPVVAVDAPDEEAAAGEVLLPVPTWLTLVHLAFVAWTVLNAHEPALFVGGFLCYLGFAKATAAYQARLDLRTPMLVGFFLAGLVIHGGLQGWWIEPVLARLGVIPLFAGSTLLTAVNDNALITYLATLVPDLGPEHKLAVVRGAVVGGGLTVIANAPNPAGQALLGRFFPGGISPLWLLLGALGPTLIAALVMEFL